MSFRISFLRVVSTTLTPIALALLLLAGCGKAGQNSTFAPEPDVNALSHDDDAEDLLPGGASDWQRENLEAEFIRQLEAQYGYSDEERFASIVPEGESGRVDDLSFDLESRTLSWTYKNPGDYNADGQVNIADVAQISNHYLAKTDDGMGDDAREEWIDGSRDGEVGLSDVAHIAANYLHDVRSYQILTSVELNGEYTPIGEVVYPAGTVVFPPVVELELPPDAMRFVKVRPVDLGGNTGEQSLPVDVIEGITLPRIVSVEPTSEESGQEVEFIATAFGNAPLEYFWNFGGGAEPNTSTEPTPVVTLLEPGEYAANLVVANEFGTDTYEFTLAVLEPGTPPSVIFVSPLSGFLGSAVGFEAEVTGSLPMDYSWDFGSGATPGQSSEKSPEVLLGAVGAFNGSLTVTNEFGQHVFQFKLIVTVEPPVILGVSPVFGTKGEESTFSAEISGTPPTDYYWEFGSGTYPHTSMEESPTVLFSVPGVYYAKLIVANSADRDDLPFTLTLGAAPVILNLKDKSGIKGEGIILSAGISGSQPISYEWNFGGAASPNESESPVPYVTLEERGLHTASLLLESPFGTDFQEFDLVVRHSTEITAVDSIGDFGSATSIKLDSSGFPHISYRDSGYKDLRYAFFNGIEWSIEVVDSEGDVGRNTSLALNEFDRPHISYYDHTNFALKYALYDGTGWKLEMVDDEKIEGELSSIAVDDEGNPHIAYLSYIIEGWVDRNLKYATFDGFEWMIEVVDGEGSAGSDPSIAIDSQGLPRISYYDNTNSRLKYARNSGDGWVVEVVDNEGNTGHQSSLALDAEDKPHIAYQKTSGYDLMYAFFDGEEWRTETVDDEQHVGAYGGIALDAAGYPHISYHSLRDSLWNMHDLRYAWFDGSVWILEVVDSFGVVGGYTSIAIDADDNTHISYFDWGNDDLKYAFLD